MVSTLARSRGVSASTLARSAIRSIADSGCLDPYATGPKTLATDRITIRLRTGDGQAIARRAAERGMRPSAYLAALVRAHVAIDPPIPTAELDALKRGITLLSRVSFLLARAAHQPALGGPGLADVRENIRQLRGLLAALEHYMHEFVRKALISWETDRV